jgi:chemotaxis protein MotA
MFALIGIIAGVICVLLGFIMHGGQVAVLIQPTEFIMIFGGAFGIFVASNGMKVTQQTFRAVMRLFKPEATKQQYIDLLKMMYQLFSVARKEGLLGLESHVENPDKSNIISKYPSFTGNHHALAFFADTMKVVLTGAVGPHDLSEMMEIDLETAHQEESLPGEALQNVADAMPAMGIVAAVLGVIMTMSKIGGEASEIGMSVAVALVGTFLGIFVAYIVFGPLSRALLNRVRVDGQYLNCIRNALFSFARGESPITCVEFARRNIDPSVRPGFVELERAVKDKAAA